MKSATLPVAIDARPRGPHGPLAAERVLGRSVLDRHVDQVLSLTPQGRSVEIHARIDEHLWLASLLEGRQRERVRMVTDEPRAGVLVVRTDRLYETGRLRRALRNGRSPESAAIWRLDRPESLQAADDELTRRLTYQPLGRYWAFPMAEWLAAKLAPMRVSPNALTLLAAAFMLSAAVIVGTAGTGVMVQAGAAVLMAIALVLDTADGRLARLQGTSSEFGRWLDGVLDELADLVLHAAIAWSVFASRGQPAWLVMGMVYVIGKYMFFIQSMTGGMLESGAALAPVARKMSTPRRLVAALGHADLRWHAWIVLAAVGRLDLALVIHAAYFPLRALAGGLRKAVAHG